MSFEWLIPTFLQISHKFYDFVKFQGFLNKIFVVDSHAQDREMRLSNEVTLHEVRRNDANTQRTEAGKGIILAHLLYKIILLHDFATEAHLGV